MKIYLYALSISTLFVLFGCNRSVEVSFDESAQLYILPTGFINDAEQGIKLKYSKDKVNDNNYIETHLPKASYFRILKLCEQAYIQRYDREKHKRLGVRIVQDNTYFIDLVDHKDGLKLLRAIQREMETSFNPTEKNIKVMAIDEVKAFIGVLYRIKKKMSIIK